MVLGCHPKVDVWPPKEIGPGWLEPKPDGWCRLQPDAVWCRATPALGAKTNEVG